MKWKYIVFKDGSSKMFSSELFHCFLTEGKEVLSAGFVRVSEEGVPLEVYGESTTLGVKSRPEDLEILTKKH